MNERFTLDSTVTEISENERVNKKLPIFFEPCIMQSDKMAILQNEIEKYDEDDEVPGTGVGGCRQFYSGET